MRHKNKGFTLVELMIVIAIIGILSAIAYPSYTEYVTRAKRADAMDSLTPLVARMEEYYGLNGTYDGATINAAGTGTVGGNESVDKYYTLSIPVADAYSYMLVATPVRVGSDPDCTTLSLDSLGQKAATGADATNCW